MEVLNRNYEVLHWEVNPAYFEKYGKVSCEAGTSYNIEPAPANTADFTYTLYFRARDGATGETFADYNSRLALNLRLEDDNKDAAQLVDIIKELHDSVISYIQINTEPHTHHLITLPHYEINEHNLTRMEASIKLMRERTPYDKQTDEERYAREVLKSVISNTRVNTVVNRIDIADK